MIIVKHLNRWTKYIDLTKNYIKPSTSQCIIKFKECKPELKKKHVYMYNFVYSYINQAEEEMD